MLSSKRAVRFVALLFFIGLIAASLPVTVPADTSASTPQRGRALRKPDDLVIQLPWTQYRMVERGSLTYGTGDHLLDEEFALDFLITAGSGGAAGHESDVRAVASGKVIWAGWYQSTNYLGFQCYGNSVAIQHHAADGRYFSFYTHLDSIYTLPTDGNVVQGFVIGKEGWTGNKEDQKGQCEGDKVRHLHFVLGHIPDSNASGSVTGGTAPAPRFGNHPPDVFDPVIPEPFIGKDVYENFQWWRGQMTAKDLASGSGNPGGYWLDDAVTDGTRLNKNTNSVVKFRVHASDPVGIKEIHFTAWYKGWSNPSGSWSSFDESDERAIWRILAVCRPSDTSDPCFWYGNNDISFDWNPWAEPDPASSQWIDKVEWLPNYDVAPVAGAGKSELEVCVSVDVVSVTGAINFAPNGTQCTSDAVAAAASTSSTFAWTNSVTNASNRLSSHMREVLIPQAAAAGNGARLIVLELDGSSPSPPPTSDGIEVVSVSNHNLVPGEQFRPTVSIKVTSGELRQDRGDMLRCNDPNCDNDPAVRFNAFPHIAVVGNVGTGQTYSFTFYENDPMMAPSTPGTYTSNWRVWRNGQWAGPNISITFRVGEGIQVCDGQNFTGECYSFPAGKFMDLREYGWYDRIESVKFVGNYKYQYHVVLNSELNLSGNPVHLDDDAGMLDASVHNHVRSMEIYRTGGGIKVCDGENFGEPCKVFGSGKYNDLRNDGWYDRIESVQYLGKYVGNYHVVLNSETNFTGNPVHLDADASRIDASVRNHTRSMEIYCRTCPLPEPLTPPDANFDEDDVVTLSWSSNATDYTVEVWSGPNDRRVFGPQTSTSLTLGTLTSGTTYYWRINARYENAAGESGWSPGHAFHISPNAPTNIAVNVASCQVADITWTDASNVEDGFNVYRTHELDTVLVGTTGPNARSLRDSSLDGALRYSYFVKSFKGNVASVASTSVDVTACPAPLPPASADVLFGNGQDLDRTVAVGEQAFVDDTRSALGSTSAAGQRTVPVASSAGFQTGHEVLIVQMQGTGAGHYEFGKVESVSGNSLTLEADLTNTYTVGGVSRAQAIRVLNFANLTVRSNGVVTAHLWDGATGGIVVFRVQGELLVESGAAVSATGLGFRGGIMPDSGWTSDGYNGESYTGPSTHSRSANGGGGGGGCDFQNAGGNGGSHGTPGTVGRGNLCGQPGATHGVSSLSQIFLGSGGGSAGGCCADGGTGGGSILAFGRNLSILGEVQSNGANGQNGVNNGPAGGAGSGGSIKLTGGSVTIGSNRVLAKGGIGGDTAGIYGGNGERVIGGNGGDGRIRVEFCESLSGTTSPVASTQQLNCETNSSPTLRPIGDQFVDAGSRADIQIAATDADNDPIILSAQDLPPFATFQDQGDGTATLSLAPSVDDDGVYSGATIIASDGILSHSETITITVHHRNGNPTVIVGADASITEGTLFTQSGSFSDGDSVTWTATVNYGDDTGIESLSLNPDKSFNLSHRYDSQGSYTVKVCVTDDDGGSGCDDLLVTVSPRVADLSISMTDAPDPVTGGQELIYTVTVTNLGSSNATDVTITNVLPGSVHFTSAIFSQGICSTIPDGAQPGGTLICSQNSLESGATTTLTINVSPPATGGTITNSVAVRANEHDPETSNNTTSEQTIVTEPLPGIPQLLAPDDRSFLDEGAVSLSWSASGTTYLGEIWGGPGDVRTFGPQSATSTDLGPLPVGYTYYWHVKALNASGQESAWSTNRSFYAVPNTPTSLRVEVVSCRVANLFWEDRSQQEERYEIYRDGVYEGGWTGPNTESYQETALSPNTTYEFTVKAVTGIYPSAPSNAVQITTPSCPINQPPVVDAGPDQTVTDDNNDGVELVTLDGSRSYDPEGQIQSVKWYEKINGTMVEVSSDLTVGLFLAVGAHSFDLHVTDSQGVWSRDDLLVTVLAPAVEPDIEPPSVNWTSPVSNEGVFPIDDARLIDLEVGAADNIGVTEVAFERWDAVNLVMIQLGSDSSAPYVAQVDSTSLNTGWNEVRATAVDQAGNSTTKYIWIDRQPQPDNLLENPSFEIDDNGDNRPDNWTSNAKFTRSTTEVREGAYSGRHSATNNSGFTISQTVSNLSAGTDYTFSGMVNIPRTSDSFTLKLQIRWLNGSGNTISTTTLRTFSKETAGWESVSVTTTAPNNTAKAEIRMVVSSLNAKIYVDDFVFRQGTRANQPPVASDQSISAVQNAPIDITLSASDPDANPLSFSVVAQPVHGTLSGVAPNLTYTPNADFTGSDAFTFKANDGTVDSNVATVAITVSALLCPDASSEPDNSAAQARPFTVGSTETHGFCADNDEDWVSILMTAGTSYRIEAVNLAPDTATVLELYDNPNGSYIRQNVNVRGGSEWSSLINFTPSTSGTYYVRVYSVLIYDGYTAPGNPDHTYDLRIVRNLVKNAGFSQDDNGDNRPDNWTSNAKFTRSTGPVYEGPHAGRHAATNNSGYTISQTVSNLSGGTNYVFRGQVNIPQTGDGFTFKLQIRWINGSGNTISTTTIRTFSASTNGWVEAAQTVKAPSGTAKAEIRMVVSSLNATIYIDDVALWQQ